MPEEATTAEATEPLRWAVETGKGNHAYDHEYLFAKFTEANEAYNNINIADGQKKRLLHLHPDGSKRRIRLTLSNPSPRSTAVTVGNFERGERPIPTSGAAA